MELTKYRIIFESKIVEFKTQLEAQLWASANGADGIEIREIIEQTAAEDAGTAKKEQTINKSFGVDLMLQFFGENKFLGMGTDQAVRTVQFFRDIILAFQVGAIEVGIQLLQTLPDEAKDPEFVTDERILLYVKKCKDYLELLRSLNP